MTLARKLLLAVPAALVVFAGAGLRAQEHAQGRILAVLAGDTDDPRIGKSVARDLENVKRLLQDGFRNHKDRLHFEVLQGKTFTREVLRESLRALSTGPDDVVVFFLAAHGGFDKRQGHFFLMDGGQGAIFRSEVRETLLEKQPRLAVLLSDTCSEYLDSTEFRAEKDMPDLKTIAQLFLSARGVVDINAVAEGEYAWGNSRHGGFFTFSFVNTLRKPFKELDADGDGFVHWHEIVPRLQENTQASYAFFRSDVLKRSEQYPPRVGKTLKSQAFQSVRVYSLPPVWRFGVRVLENGGDGVKIALVHERTPAARAELKSGDVLLKIGNTPVRSAADFLKAVDQAGAQVNLEVRRIPSNRIETVPISLMPWAGTFTDG